MTRIIKIILSWSLVIAVPVVSLGLACNALIRLPDVYQYAMNDTQVLKSFNAGGQEENVAKCIATYMQHRSEELQYQYDEEDEMSLLFSRDEQNLMKNIRFETDIWALVFIVALILTVVALIVLTKGGHYEIIRHRIKLSIAVYVGAFLTLGVLLFIPAIWDKLSLMFTETLEEEQILYLLFSGNFFRMYSIAVEGIAAVIMGIFSYLLLKYIKPKTIFW